MQPVVMVLFGMVLELRSQNWKISCYWQRLNKVKNKHVQSDEKATFYLYFACVILHYPWLRLLFITWIYTVGKETFLDATVGNRLLPSK